MKAWPSVMERRRVPCASNVLKHGASSRKPWIWKATLVGDARGFDSYESDGFYDEWTHSGRVEERVSGREFIPRRRQQEHLGPARSSHRSSRKHRCVLVRSGGGMNRAKSCCRFDLLDRSLHGAHRECGPVHRCQFAPGARSATPERPSSGSRWWLSPEICTESSSVMRRRRGRRPSRS